MAGVNKAIILGNLGRDPELTTTPSGLAVCKFSLATSKKTKAGEEITQWHRCTAFNKPAEVIAQYVKKGQQLYVEGEITYSQYEKDGIPRYSTDIIVREFNFVGSGGGGGQSQGQGGYQGGQGGNQNQGGGYNPNGGNQGNTGNQGGYKPPAQNNQGGGNADDDQIPF